MAPGTSSLQVPQGALPNVALQKSALSSTVCQVQDLANVKEGSNSPSSRYLHVAQDLGVHATLIGAPALETSPVARKFADLIPEVVDDDEFEAYVPFETKRYNVVNTCDVIKSLICCPCLGCISQTLILEDEEVILRRANLCGVTTQRRPYAQLGPVAAAASPCGCVKIVTDLAPMGFDGNGGLSPGLGCERRRVREIVEELQSRRRKRGSCAEMRKLELMYSKVAQLASQMPLLLDALGLKYAPKQPLERHAPKVFDRRVLDVSNAWEQIFCCGSKQLVLEQEEAVLTASFPCGLASISRRRDYAGLGSVQTINDCFCCRSASSELGLISPGCGCDESKVCKINSELRNRMAEQGQAGQIHLQENIFAQLAEVLHQTPLVMTKLGVADAPSQEEMRAVSDREPPVALKTYDVTNLQSSCCTCCLTCGVAGRTSSTLEMRQDSLVLIEKNNIEELSCEQPYGQIDINWKKSCCCCYTVNNISPGWGSNKRLVEEVSVELQKRKVERGRIAQLKRLKAMRASLVKLDCQADLLLRQEGLHYPPPQETIERLYRGRVPKVLTPQVPLHEVKAPETFDTKTYDVTDKCGSACGLLLCPCCGWTSRILELELEEMVITSRNLCDTITSRTPYAQLNSVDVDSSCCCYELPEIGKPGCGCDKEYVNEIASQLQERRITCGSISELKAKENLMNEISKLCVKVDLLLDKHRVEYPPSQETMARLHLPPTES